MAERSIGSNGNSAGYSTRSLPEKLGVPADGKGAFALRPPDGYDVGIPALDAVPLAPPHTLRFLHAFYADRATLQSEILRLAEILRYDGILWISWPKRASGVRTDLSDNVVRDVALATHVLVDVKVCAVDAVWSGLKVMYRKSARPA